MRAVWEGACLSVCDLRVPCALRPFQPVCRSPSQCLTSPRTQRIRASCGTVRLKPAPRKTAPRCLMAGRCRANEWMTPQTQQHFVLIYARRR